MATPRIFISSTCYDLKYIRENLKYFIRSLGYEPVLSEEGSIFYDPSMSVQDACLADVPSCQMFVLIVGGRYGSQFKDSSKSITNHEFNEAVKNKVPIFALVEQGVYEQHYVYLSNVDNSSINTDKVVYPAVDSTKIFSFIGEVQSKSTNNALVPFADFEGIQSYLKQQWAGMLYRYLTAKNEENRVIDLFQEISTANEKIEFLSRQVLNAVGDPISQLKVQTYDYLIGLGIAHNLNVWDIKPTPDNFVDHETLDSLCGSEIVVMHTDGDDEYSGSSITWGGPPYRAGQDKLDEMREEYVEARQEIMKIISEAGVNIKEFVDSFNK